MTMLFTRTPRCLRLHAITRKYTSLARLEERGLVQQLSSQKLDSFLAANNTTVYTGFDPTAKSLHVGNLLAIIGLLHFQALGHQPIALIGGATGSIGDPSGRSTERVALDPATLHANVNAIQSQLAEIFDNATNYIIAKNALSVPSQNIKPVKVLNNLDWFNNMSILDFLADTGRLARVSIMLARESVKNRLQSPEGISFTEFSYQLLQAYDFYHLYSSHNCKIQIGGSDQWGNIMAGMDIIRKKLSSHNHSPDPSSNPSPESDIEPTAFALTMPLVTTATGEKFGKSAGNAIWLDENMLSHYDFYQFFRRTPDSQVERYLKYFTLLPLQNITQTMQDHMAAPEKHLPQRLLAQEVTELVHGADASRRATVMTNVLFDKNPAETSGRDIVDAFAGDDRFTRLPRVEVVGHDIVQVAVAAKAVKSKSSGRKLLMSGGLYLNNQKVLPNGHIIQQQDLIDDMVLLLRSGKNNYKVIQIV